LHLVCYAARKSQNQLELELELLDGGVELAGYTLINLSSSYAINNNAKVLLNSCKIYYGTTLLLMHFQIFAIVLVDLILIFDVLMPLSAIFQEIIYYLM
jgi:hypothetical protein